MRNLVFLISILLFYSCEIHDEEAPGFLVPPTAHEDPDLPQIAVHVSGRERALHLQTFGNPENPPALVLHGGPGADFRLLLPLKALADNFFVVMWDSRGAGLSERVTKEELSIDSFIEEVNQVKNVVAHGRKVTLIGHSFGANVLLRFTASHPEEVAKLILIEPGQIDLSKTIKYKGGAVSFTDGQEFFWQNEILTSKDHASADYKGIEVLPKSSRNWDCEGKIIENYPFWRFGAYHYHVVQKNIGKVGKSLHWADGFEDFPGEVSVIAGSCGALGEDFQTRYNLPDLPKASLKIIEGAGHITLFTDYAESTVEAVRKSLN